MIKIKNNTWSMPSQLDSSTVPTIAKKYIKQIPTNNCDLILDFSSCTKVDSSGLAMIVDFIKHTKNSNVSLQLKNLSEEALSLAKAHGLDETVSKYITK